jgi:serine/threonine kinase 3
MCEGKPPYADIHPMRAIFMIPIKQPPTLTEQKNWSLNLNDFIQKCLNKNIKCRPSASELLQHPLIRKIDFKKSRTSIIEIINKALTIQQSKIEKGLDTNKPMENFVTAKEVNDNTTRNDYDTVKINDLSIISSEMNTMIINNSADNTYDMQTFIKKHDTIINNKIQTNIDQTTDFELIHQQMQKEMKNLIDTDNKQELNLTVQQVQLRLKYLDTMMKTELDELKIKYEQKRQPILDAIEQKNKLKII